jgi:hypothetical protein
LANKPLSMVSRVRMEATCINKSIILQPRFC